MADEQPIAEVQDFRESEVLSELFAVAIVDSKGDEGRIVYANELLCELSGWSQDELNGQPLNVLIPEKSREAHHHYRQGFMKRPSARPMGPDREVVLLHKAGREIRVWVGLSPLDEKNVTAVILPMDIGRSFGLGKSGE